MPSEPEKSIEEKLKASARERREQFGPDPAMPGPMRALLHAEMEAQFRRHAPVETGGRFFAWWPLLAAGTAVAILIGGPVVWELRNKEAPVGSMPSRALAEAGKASSAGVPAPAAPVGLLALNEKMPMNPADSRIAADEKSNLVAMEGAEASKALDSMKKKDSDFVEPRAAMDSETAPAPALDAGASQIVVGSRLALADAKPGENKDRASMPGSLLKSEARKMETDTGQIIAGSVAGAAQGQANFAAQNGSAPASQAFRSIATQQQKLNVLSRFVVEQTGDIIRFHDADGSTYTGQIRSTTKRNGGIGGGKRGVVMLGYTSQPSAPQAATAKEAQKDAEAGLAANAYDFRVTGTSTRLNKVVVFEGTFLAANPGAGVLQGSSSSLNAEMLNNRNTQNSQSPPNPNQTVRITGRVTVAGGNPVEIEAISVGNP